MVEPKITLQRDVLESWLKVSGCTRSQLARQLCISKGRISQLFHFDQEPSARLIAGLLSLTKLPFDRLFALKSAKVSLRRARKPSQEKRGQTFQLAKVGFLAMTLATLHLFLSGCGPRSAEAVVEKPAVVINKLELTQEELKQELKATSSLGHGALTPTGEEPEWLSRLIERELLVQEAQHLGLDREPNFMRTIERFWKEALIKLLLNRKAQEIGDQIRVYEPEIEEGYKELVKEGGGQPIGSLSELRGEISRTIRQKKETEAMD